MRIEEASEEIREMRAKFRFLGLDGLGLGV